MCHPSLISQVNGTFICLHVCARRSGVALAGVALASLPAAAGARISPRSRPHLAAPAPHLAALAPSSLICKAIGVRKNLVVAEPRRRQDAAERRSDDGRELR